MNSQDLGSVTYALLRYRGPMAVSWIPPAISESIASSANAVHQEFIPNYCTARRLHARTVQLNGTGLQEGLAVVFCAEKVISNCMESFFPQTSWKRASWKMGCQDKLDHVDTSQGTR